MHRKRKHKQTPPDPRRVRILHQCEELRRQMEVHR